MATIAARKIIEGGTAESLSNCTSGGDEFRNTGVEFLHIVNDHASQAYNITIVAQTTSIRHPNYGTLTKSNQTEQVNAGNEAFMGPFKPNAFNNTNNKVEITYLTTGGAAISTVSSGTHALKLEVLYLDQT